MILEKAWTARKISTRILTARGIVNSEPGRRRKAGLGPHPCLPGLSFGNLTAVNASASRALGSCKFGVNDLTRRSSASCGKPG